MREDLHQLEVEPVERWAERSADWLARAIRAALARYERCTLALSGGSTPWPVYRELARRPLDWDRVVLTQVDERLVELDDPDRNLRSQQEIFDGLPVSWLPLPVDELLTVDPGDEARVEAILGHFAAELVAVADDPPVVDVVQLGLGTDGHTASLVPGDPVVDELRRYVALTGPYGGHRRVTLTRPVLDRARIVIWFVTGGSKAAPLGRLLEGDLTIPAGIVRPRQSIVIADSDAARQV